MKEVYSNLYNYLQLAMVIQEILRLYPVLPVVTRAALQDIKFKDILIPKGMNVWVPVAMLQQHPDIWGTDAHEFNTSIQKDLPRELLGLARFHKLLYHLASVLVPVLANTLP